jgi:formate hydrogenlyase subunit 6/NADH:ubiquinone oxidoreductase subunit I
MSMRFLPEALKSPLRKPATIRYPAQKPAVHPRFRGKHEWDRAKCIFCLQCMLSCPTGAIMIDKERKRYFVDFGKCIFCGACQEICPVPGKAIRLGPGFELAVTEKGKARERMGAADREP